MTWEKAYLPKQKDPQGHLDSEAMNITPNGKFVTCYQYLLSFWAAFNIICSTNLFAEFLTLIIQKSLRLVAVFKWLVNREQKTATE